MIPAFLVCISIFVTFLLIFVPLIPIHEPKECFTTPCDQYRFVTLIDLVFPNSDNLPLDPNADLNEPAFCIEVYQPVCGTDGKTYSNMCFLDLAETDLDHQGEC